MFKEAKKPAAERVSDFDAQAKELIALLAIAEAHLGGHEFFALNRLTIADMALGPILKRCVAFPIGVPSFSNVGRWIAHLDSRPAFQFATGAKPATVSSAA
jgi:glutathione S-transferase